MKHLHHGLFLALAVLLFPAFASARPFFVFKLKADGVELKQVKHTPNTAKNPRNTRTYSATVKKGATFTLDVGEYLTGGELPQPQRAEISVEDGSWKHDEKFVRARPSVLEGEKFSHPGPTTAFTALKPGVTTLVFELDDRPGPKRKHHASTHVVWCFKVEVTIR